MRKNAEPKATARTWLLDAALLVMRAKGYTATTVDDLCEAAGVTKGAFFHHFKSKEDLAIAAARHWSETTNTLFQRAPYHRHADPLDRVLGYLEFRKALLKGALPQFTCFAGTMVQETYETHPAIRDACNASIVDHAATLASDIAAAIEKHGVKADVSPSSLALYTQAVLQGAFILAKARNSPEIAAECVEHLTRYFRYLFAADKEETKDDR